MQLGERYGAIAAYKLLSKLIQRMKVRKWRYLRLLNQTSKLRCARRI